MSERWKPVPGYEGSYEVSDHGRVKSLPRHRVPMGCTLKQAPTRQGYATVNLWKHGIHVRTAVHALVLLAFVGPRPLAAKHIRHLNGDESDNRLTNLAYGTASENMFDRIRHGTHHEVNKTHCSKGHRFTAENVYHPPTRPRSRNCRQCAADNRNRRRAHQRAAGLPVT